MDLPLRLFQHADVFNLLADSAISDCSVGQESRDTYDSPAGPFFSDDQASFE